MRQIIKNKFFFLQLQPGKKPLSVNDTATSNGDLKISVIQ